MFISCPTCVCLSAEGQATLLSVNSVCIVLGVSCPWSGTADQNLISEFTLVVRAPVLLPCYF